MTTAEIMHQAIPRSRYLPQVAQIKLAQLIEDRARHVDSALPRLLQRQIAALELAQDLDQAGDFGEALHALGVVDSPPTTVPEAAVDATIEAVGRMVDAATDALGAVNRAARRRR